MCRNNKEATNQKEGSHLQSTAGRADGMNPSCAINGTSNSRRQKQMVGSNRRERRIKQSDQTAKQADGNRETNKIQRNTTSELHRKRPDGKGKEKGRIGADGKRSSRTEGRRLKTEGGRLESRSIIDSDEADGGKTKIATNRGIVQSIRNKRSESDQAKQSGQQVGEEQRSKRRRIQTAGET